MHTHIGRLTSPQAARRADAVLAVPVGSTEQHGPHLPLSTDTDIAVALTRSLCERRGDVLAAPPVAYGSSGEHQDFAGTLSIGAQALETLLIELGRSSSRSFSRLLLVSCHGGNAVPVSNASERLRYEGRDVLAWSPRWRGDAHAGRTETSVQLALRPDVVHADLAEAGTTGPIAELLPELRRAGVRGVSANGVLGDPRGASSAEGERLLDEALDDLCATLDDWLATTG